jgi:N-acetylmuramoyl-L-alanine amidase
LSSRPARFPLFGLFLLLLSAGAACGGLPGQHEAREGDEIVVAGQFFHTGTKVVLWMDPGGYDAYRVQRRFVPIAQSGWRESSAHLGSPNRYGIRAANLTPAQLERIRGGGWDLPTLQSTIDQFVLHFDVEGTSRACFRVLQDQAGLSVHFMCDLDGTIYQTLDLKEEAWHATSSNNRSVGVEIANVGAYPDGSKDPFETWYKTSPTGQLIISIPAQDGPERRPHFVGRPARREVIHGEIHGRKLRQHDFTPQQYEALARLTATLCIIFPKIKCDYPREADGKLMTHRLPTPELQNYQGVLGHYHIQTDKDDPGPALQWDYIIDEARQLMKLPPARNVAGETVGAPVKLMVDN